MYVPQCLLRLSFISGGFILRKQIFREWKHVKKNKPFASRHGKFCGVIAKENPRHTYGRQNPPGAKFSSLGSTCKRSTLHENW